MAMLVQGAGLTADESAISAIAHVIELAVAPVFLLTGIATMLNVLAGRFGRIIDRARAIEAAFESYHTMERPAYSAELATLATRSRLISVAMALAVLSALLIAATVAGLFVSALVQVNITLLAAGLFVGAMAAMIAALLLFLREVQLATTSLRIGPR
jgi:hypothetical protein